MQELPALVASAITCALCGGTASRLVKPDGAQEASFECAQCRLLQRAAEDHPSSSEERAFYSTHENEYDDPRYRAFLNRLVEPLSLRLRQGARGLDFGCGPTPLLAKMMGERGYETASYDPLFAPDSRLLTARYSFVSASEVVEHFRDPRASWQLLFSLLEPGGTLGVMTEWYRGQSPLASWRYARDPTHLCFYRQETFAHLAAMYSAEVHFPSDNVCLFHAPWG